ncbi:MAG: glycosyl transferase, partial [Desulfobacterales bacterium]
QSPSQWFLRQMGCPESFTEPNQIYRIAKQKGMSLVTITDHNRIEGALEIAHLPGTFVSEEVTTFFPEDKCKVHVLVYNISEKQHIDIQKARQNLFELVWYLQQHKIVHALAHALFSPNDRLTLEKFERLLLLFKNFELNGDSNPEANHSLKKILSAITRPDIDRLVQKHNLETKTPRPWQKNLVGGSDDHSSLNIARAYTEVKGADSVASFLDGIENNHARAVQQPSSPQNLAHNIYSVAYQFYYSKFNLQQHVYKDTLLEFINAYLGPHRSKNSGFIRKRYFSWQQKRGQKNNGWHPKNSYEFLRKETMKLIDEDPSIVLYRKIGHEELKPRENLWFNVINKVANRVISQIGNQLMGQISRANILEAFNTIASAGGIYTMLAPYFVAFSQHAKQRRFSHLLLRRFKNELGRKADQDYSPKTVIFADSYKNLKDAIFASKDNGQGLSRRFKNTFAVTCDTEQRTSFVLETMSFDPIGVYEFSDYPGIQLLYPPVIDMLNYCYEQKFTRIHVLTPGPLGLAGLLIARILKLPIDCTYQGSLPAYVHCITNDESIEHLIRRYSIWFYNQMGSIYTTSAKVARKMVQEGIQAEQIKAMDPWQDAGNGPNFKSESIFKDRFYSLRGWSGGCITKSTVEAAP